MDKAQAIKKNKTVKWKTAVWVGVIFLLAVGFIFRFLLINREYPAPEKIWYEQNQAIPLPNAELRLTNIKYGTAEELLAEKNLKKEQVFPTLAEAEMRIVTADCTLKNTSGSAQEFYLGDFVMQNRNLSASLSYELWSKFNDGLTATPSLEPGEEYSATLVFAMYQTTYPKSFWDVFDEYPTDLVLSVYPNKSMVRAHG